MLELFSSLLSHSIIMRVEYQVHSTSKMMITLKFYISFSPFSGVLPFLSFRRYLLVSTQLCEKKYVSNYSRVFFLLLETCTWHSHIEAIMLAVNKRVELMRDFEWMMTNCWDEGARKTPTIITLHWTWTWLETNGGRLLLNCIMWSKLLSKQAHTKHHHCCANARILLLIFLP